jgi:hypothetical protein
MKSTKSTPKGAKKSAATKSTPKQVKVHAGVRAGNIRHPD